MDRQDIDALLIGALYGELTPADEARLTAHLESHPGDRGALDDLKVARQAVLDSRIFAVQAEPPQAVSALLLQEAHRRAPKRVAAREEEKESWFFRFTRTFLAHPAMAAAAMLVLVLGGAGIVYMRKGDDQFAARQVEAPAAQDQAAMAPAGNTASLEQGSAADGAAAGSGFQAGLYEGNGVTAHAEAEKADEAKPADSAADRWDEQQALDNKKQALAKQEQQRDGALKAKRATSSSIAIGTEKGAVKELEKPRAKAAKSDDDVFGMGGDSMAAPGASGGGGAGAAAPSTGAASGRGTVAADKGGYAQPPPPPAQVAQAAPAPTATPPAEPKADSKKTAAPAKPAPTSTTTAIAKAPPKAAENTKAESKPDSSLIAWAKGEHARAVALAQKGECTSAAKVALSVSSRASEYYAQFMATDRALKQCAQYINAERDKEAEKSSKARAQKRTNAADEAPAPTTTK